MNEYVSLQDLTSYKYYNAPPVATVSFLLRKVDTLPISLPLSSSASSVRNVIYISMVISLRVEALCFKIPPMSYLSLLF